MPVTNPAKLALMATDPSTSPLLPLPKSRKRSRSTDESDCRKPVSKIAVVEDLIRGQYTGRFEDPTLRDLERYRAVVTPSEFVDLIKSFDDELCRWLVNHLTYDWNALTGEIILRRMSPSNLHDVVAAEIGLAFRDQIVALKRMRNVSAEIKALVANIKGPYANLASPAIVHATEKSGDPNVDILLTSNRQPDNSFYFRHRSNMPIVIEVGNSQVGEELTELAESWMKDSSRKTKTVITVDLQYQNPATRADNPRTPKAAISIYRVTKDSYDKKTFTFFDSAKGKQITRTLRLTLADFLPIEEIKKFPKDFKFPAIEITAEELRDILEQGDERQQDVDRASLSPGKPLQPSKKQKRQPTSSSTPPVVSQPVPAPVGRSGRPLVKTKRYLGE
ncbi:uncharacterized protein J4E92_010381 [Alternaria infectoria]|uniref:uncharacterized protein n=1 Tax=Alternaria infectoria TaxID=45303 RepID=UPI00221E939A|nr:uncharacterized protein J4E92_010381 [Alternaria infectoria]KAI4910622.1 hypothetical protein J4E92_010381 [Alternaria infectoria]